MGSIITITVNPCIDISSSVPALLPEKKLQCGAVKKEPGGGGINVSRVINRFGGDTTAVYMAGGYTGEYFTKLLCDEGVHTHIIPIINHTRENFIIEESNAKRQYRFGLPGPYIQEAEWKQCLDAITSLHDVDYIVASGSLSPGMPVDFFAKLAFIAKQKHIKFVLDTSGEPLKAALAEGVYMIKPNLGELAYVAGVYVLDKDEAIASAQTIVSGKQAELVLLSLGPAGGLLVTGSTTDHIRPPGVQVKSTVGAGDSMLAGMILGLSKSKSLHESLQFAVACGTAATLGEGTALCSIEQAKLVSRLISAARV